LAIALGPLASALENPPLPGELGAERSAALDFDTPMSGGTSVLRPLPAARAPLIDDHLAARQAALHVLDMFGVHLYSICGWELPDCGWELPETRRDRELYSLAWPFLPPARGGYVVMFLKKTRRKSPA